MLLLFIEQCQLTLFDLFLNVTNELLQFCVQCHSQTIVLYLCVQMLYVV